MTLEIQFKIKNNPYYTKYLRENSYWYKYLNRNEEYFKQFEEEVKEKYRLRKVDRISNVLDTMEMLGTLVSNIK